MKIPHEDVHLPGHVPQGRCPHPPQPTSLPVPSKAGLLLIKTLHRPRLPVCYMPTLPTVALDQPAARARVSPAVPAGMDT